MSSRGNSRNRDSGNYNRDRDDAQYYKKKFEERDRDARYYECELVKAEKDLKKCLNENDRLKKFQKGRDDRVKQSQRNQGKEYPKQRNELASCSSRGSRGKGNKKDRYFYNREKYFNLRNNNKKKVNNLNSSRNDNKKKVNNLNSTRNDKKKNVNDLNSTRKYNRSFHRKNVNEEKHNRKEIRKEKNDSEGRNKGNGNIIIYMKE